jgi:hypothetical protein
LLREGNRKIKEKFETLLQGGIIRTPIDEQIIYNQLDDNESAIWSLLLASGYLKVLSYERPERLEFDQKTMYELTLTNYEVLRMFNAMVQGWFNRADEDYNDFVEAMLLGDLDAMNVFMNDMASELFSYFDSGKKPSRRTPERLPSGKATAKGLTEPNPSVCFYHGFVLGLLVDLRSRYIVTSNRESGFGRYDVMLEPRNKDEDDGLILEFKVHDKTKEETLEDTVAAALRQIEDKKYAAELMKRGVPEERIRCYGFAFEGNKVLIGD